MCGEFSTGGRDSDDDFVLIGFETVRARKPHQCVACYGAIPVGAYHCRMPFVIRGDRRDDHRFHLQCRDVANQINWFGPDVITDFAEDDERGPEWVEHHRATAVWAAGGEYRRAS